MRFLQALCLVLIVPPPFEDIAKKVGLGDVGIRLAETVPVHAAIVVDVPVWNDVVIGAEDAVECLHGFDQLSPGARSDNLFNNLVHRWVLNAGCVAAAGRVRDVGGPEIPLLIARAFTLREGGQDGVVAVLLDHSDEFRPLHQAVARADAQLAKILEDPEFKEIVDSCINCKRCLTECPSGVDVPWLAIVGRHEYVDKKGESFTNRVLTDTRSLCSQGSMLAPIANFATSLAPIRWGLQKAIGLEAKRYLPQFRNQTLRKILKSRKQSTSSEEVVFFLGCYANYNDPEGEGLAVVDVLEQNGLKVVMPEFRCCGIARISAGAQHQIIDDIRFNINLLHEYASRGVPIIFSEPSCELAVKKEYPRIVDTAEARVVAEHCYDIHQYLMNLHKEGRLNTEFNRLDMSVGYHAPCHLKSVGVTREPIELMELIPGITVKPFSDKCCGMGGTYGLKANNYDLSMKIGKRLFEEVIAADVDQVVTGCGACGMQIFQGTARESCHPLKLLAKAYGKERIVA